MSHSPHKSFQQLNEEMDESDLEGEPSPTATQTGSDPSLPISSSADITMVETSTFQQYLEDDEISVQNRHQSVSPLLQSQMRRVLQHGNRSKLVGFNPHRATLSSASVSRSVEDFEMDATADGNFASDPFSPSQPGPAATSTPKRKQGPVIDASFSPHDSLSAGKLTITQLSQVNGTKKTKWSHSLQRGTLSSQGDTSVPDAGVPAPLSQLPWLASYRHSTRAESQAPSQRAPALQGNPSSTDEPVGPLSYGRPESSSLESPCSSPTPLTIPPSQSVPEHVERVDATLAMASVRPSLNLHEEQGANTSKDTAHEYLASHNLLYNESLKAVICQCGIWVDWPNVAGHLQKAHKVSNCDAAEMERARITLGGVIGTPHPPSDQEAILGLPVRSAYMCGVYACSVVMVAENSMLSHHSQHHPKTRAAQNKWVACEAQQLNRSDAKSYFRVKSPPPPLESERDAAVENVLREDAERKDTVPPHLKEDQRLVERWLLVNKWDKIVGDRSPADVKSLVDKGGEIGNLGIDVPEFFLRCDKLLISTPDLVLQQLNTKEPKKGLNHRPFKAHQESATTSNYVSVIYKLLALLFRTEADFPENIRAKVNAYKAMDRSLGKDDDRTGAVNCVYDLLFACFGRQWLPSETDLYPDPTLRALAYLCQLIGGTWVTAKDTTGQIAKFSHAIRQVMLYGMHQSGKPLAEESERLSIWFTEGNESTFNSLQSLQHYATSLSLSTVPLPNTVFLSPDRVLFNGQLIKFSNVKKMYAAQGDELIERWERDVSLGLTPQFAIPDNSTVADDFSNTSEGYSFLTDKRNPFYLERTTVLRAVFADDALRNKFTNGIDAKTGRPRWKLPAVRSYLHQVTTFVALLLLRCCMTSGAPIRGTEVTSMRVNNTQTRRRNLFMLAQFLIILGGYSKTSALTGQDNVVAHGLDALLSTILISYLTYIQPFVNVLAGICFSEEEHPGVLHLYRHYMFVDYDDLFTTAKISDMMKRTTEIHLKASLPISKWRHISIAFRQSLCRRQLSAATAIDPGDRAAAQQAGHSHGLENRLYAISDDGIDGSTTRELNLFCAVSVAYQTVSHVVPSGISLPYKACAPDKFDHLMETGVIESLEDTSELKRAEALAVKVVDMMKPLILEAISSAGASARQTLPDPLVKEPQDAVTHDDSETGGGESDELEYVDFPEETVGLASHPSATVTPAPGTLVDETGYFTQGKAFQNPLKDPHLFQKPAPRDIFQPHTEMQQILRMSGNNQRASTSMIPGTQSSSYPASSDDDYERPVLPPLPTTWVQHPEDGLAESVQSNYPPPVFDEIRAENTLRTLLNNPKAKWNGNAQKMAVGHVILGEHDVLFTGPTASGKSLMLFIPAYQEQTKITLIILPLISLVHEYETKLQKAGLGYHVYHRIKTREGLGPDVRILLATANRLRESEFIDTIRMIHTKTPFARIATDEAHCALVDTKFRPEFFSVHRTRIVNVPLVLFTATLPPHLQDSLTDVFKVADSYVNIRSSTDRHETHYGVLPPAANSHELLCTVQNIVDSALPTFNPEDRILIYVTAKATGQAIADILGCQFYYSKEGALGKPMLTEDERKAITADFRKGTYKTLVATSAYGMGNDYSHTRIVIHAGTPNRMMDFIQESGRAGRDHLPCKSIVIPNGSIEWVLKENPQDPGGTRPMMAYVSNEEGCRRYSLNKYNDGEIRYCRDVENAQLCDYCISGVAPPDRPAAAVPGRNLQQRAARKTVHPKPPPRFGAVQRGGVPRSMLYPRGRPGTETYTDKYRKNKQEELRAYFPWVENLREALDVYLGTCIICTHRSGQYVDYHDLMSCPVLLQPRTQTEEGTQTHLTHYIYQWRSLIHYDRVVMPICYKCHIPNGPRDAPLHPKFQSGNRCRHRDILSSVAYIIGMTPTLFAEAKVKFGQNWQDLNAFRRWITETSTTYPYNIHSLFIWYYRKGFPE